MKFWISVHCTWTKIWWMDQKSECCLTQSQNRMVFQSYLHVWDLEWFAVWCGLLFTVRSTHFMAFDNLICMRCARMHWPVCMKSVSNWLKIFFFENWYVVRIAAHNCTASTKKRCLNSYCNLHFYISYRIFIMELHPMTQWFYLFIWANG